MPRTKPSSYNRRLVQLTELGIPIVRMRSCRRCTRLSKDCRVQEGSEKCVECVKKGCPCDLAPLDTGRWRRLEAQRKALKQQLREAVLKRREMQAKEDRLLSQLEYVEDEQQMMVDGELQNLEEIAPLAEEPVSEFFPEPLIDVASEQIVFPNLEGDWSFTSLAPFDGSLEMPVETAVDENAPACSGISSSS